MSGLGPSCSTVADIVGFIAWGMLLWLMGVEGVSVAGGAGACRSGLIDGASPLSCYPHIYPLPYPLLYRGLAGCFGGAPEAHSTIIPMIP